MPGDSGVLVYSCAFLPMQSAHEAAGAAGTRRSPRSLMGGRFMHDSGASRRGIAKSYFSQLFLKLDRLHSLSTDALASFCRETPAFVLRRVDSSIKLG